MNIEEHIKRLKQYIKDDEIIEKDGSDFANFCKGHIEDIQVILDELNKDTDRINDLINEVTIKDSEIELKDQVIWFMANRLTTEYHDIDWVTNYYYEEAKKFFRKKQNRK